MLDHARTTGDFLRRRKFGRVPLAVVEREREAIEALILCYRERGGGVQTARQEHDGALHLPG